MSYATLMVYVEADGIPEQRVRIASELATKFDAALIGLSARAVPPPFVAEGVIIEKHTEADIEKMRMELAKRGDWFRRVVGADSKDVQWRTALDFPGGTLVRESRCADLVIIEQRNPGRYDTYRNLDPGEVLLKIGRPTLLVGPEVASLSAEHIVVAWKDSREAHRAVLDAMPFLRKAKRVSVVEVCTRDDERHALARTEDVPPVSARDRRECTSNSSSRQIRCGFPGAFRPERECRPAGGRRLWRQPLRRVGLRRHDTQPSRDLPSLLPHVPLGSLVSHSGGRGTLGGGRPLRKGRACGQNETCESREKKLAHGKLR
jgi:hypothetical protein